MEKHRLTAKAVFDQAHEIITPVERKAYLDEVCADDPNLREKVEGLLQAYVEAGSFDGLAPGIFPTADFSIEERPGSHIGPYKLLEQIGEGGFGIVFMAEQERPVRRKVALKVLKPGMDTKQVIARFEAERQALALMDHPNIAKILEAGATDSGRPYFVMELVRGLPITDYCDQNQLTPRERLELFVTVGQAVQHAHQKGIIHRDIKPTNVLVTERDGTPVVKVIDFGIAKATDQKLTGKTLFTNFDQMIGTPLYMSPEQAAVSSLDVDTRSDIYSLGVLLYELLTGTTPFDKDRLKQAAFDEVRRIIREEEPPKPSTRISTLGQAEGTVSARRKSDPKRLSQLCRGDLDWIVMKALEKDRTRRYETANAFAADVQRYLNDQPVEACPPSALYRIRKFARRNKRALATAAILGTVLLLGVANLWQREAWRSATAQAVAKDLDEADIWQRQEQWDKALAVVDRAKARLDESGMGNLQAQVENRRRDLTFVIRMAEVSLNSFAASNDGNQDLATVDRDIAEAFMGWGLDVRARPEEASAEVIRASPMRLQLVVALDRWAQVNDRIPKGISERLRAIARLADNDPWRQKLRDPQLAKDTKRLVRMAEGEDVLDQPPASLFTFIHLLEKANARSSVVALLRRAQERYPADFWINLRLASLLNDDPATVAEAVGYERVTVALQPQSPIVYNNLGFALLVQKKLPESVAALRKAIALKPDFAGAYISLSNTLAAQGKGAEAGAALQKAIAIKPDFAMAYFNSANLLLRAGKFSEAEAAYRKAIEIQPNYPEAYTNLGAALEYHGKAGEALVAFQKAVELDPQNAHSHTELGVFFLGQRKLPEAGAAFRKAIELDTKFADAYDGLGDVLRDQGNLTEAVAAYERAIELKPDFVNAIGGLGSALRHQKKFSESAAAQRKAIALQPEDPFGHLNLGNTLLDQNKFAEAEAAYRKGIDLLPKTISAMKSARAQAHISLANVLQAQGKFTDAEAAYRKSIETNPSDVDALYNAACSAALSGCREEKQGTPDAKERARCRAQSLAWLRAALAIHRETLAKDPDTARSQTRDQMQHWLRDTDFNSVRGVAALAKLPEAERQEWRKVWEEVEELRQKATPEEALLDAILQKFLRGEMQHADAAELVALAEFCKRPHKQFYATSARLYRQAFATKVVSAGSGTGYAAVGAAALAGCGQGKDADALAPAERAGLRREALAWMRGTLSSYQKSVESRTGNDYPKIGGWLKHWQQNPDFNGVRGEAALAKLPEAERQDWRKLWEDVEELRKRAAASQPR